jgi:hypothetical protein
MNAEAGIFATRTDAERAAAALQGRAGLPNRRITLLTPGDRALTAVPTTEAEAPGVGRALGGVVGGATGAATGLQAGALLSIFVPGVGPVLALGALGALVLGVAGAAVGDTLDESSREGLPKDEVFLVEDALRQGRSVVIVVPEDSAQAKTAHRILSEAGAESLDTARERWWTGLRETESAAYPAGGGEFVRDEKDFRSGFQAALALGRPGEGWDDVVAELRARYPEACERAAFRRGWERGRVYMETRAGSSRAA